MSDLYPLFGLISIVTTPFDDQDRIDLESLARTVDDRLDAGVAGLVLPAVASEVAWLSNDERRTLIESVTAQVAGRVPVIAGASSDELVESVAIANFANEVGCAGVIAAPPLSILRDGAALRGHFEAIEQTGVPMIMIQDREPGGPGIPIDIVQMLCDAIPSFRCIKIETDWVGPKYTAVLAATRGRLNVFGGGASTQVIEALDRGVHGLMPSAHHWVFVEIQRLYADGQRDAAEALFERLLPMLAFAIQSTELSIQFQKLVAVRQGVFRSAAVRSSKHRMDEYERRIADGLADRAIHLYAELGCPTRGAGL
jgi:4-hydroxy-tetrahydrodipicolinate synthase